MSRWQSAPLVNAGAAAPDDQAAAFRWQSAPAVDDAGEATPAPAPPPVDHFAMSADLAHAAHVRDFRANTANGFTDAERAEAESNLSTLKDRATAAGVPFEPDADTEYEGAVTRGRTSRNLAAMDQAVGRPGESARESTLGQVGARNFTSIPIEQAPGAQQLLDRQTQWFADPANKGKQPPAELLQVQRDPDSPGRVRVSGQLGQQLLSSLERDVGTPNVQKPGFAEDMAFGNERQVAEDQTRRLHELNARGGVPFELLDPQRPIANQQFADQLTAPGGTNLGIAQGAVAGFVRGSNQMAADIVGGGAGIASDLTGNENIRNAGDRVAANLEGVVAANPGSANVGTLNPSNVRWWTEGTAQMLPAFAAMAAPGLAVGKVLEVAGATARATKIAQGLAAFGGNATIGATQTYGQVYQHMKQSGAAEEDARAVALTESSIVGAIDGVLGKLSFGEFFQRDPAALGTLQSAMRGFLTGGGVGGIQAWVPGAVDNLVRRGVIQAPDAQEVEHILASALQTAVMGGVAEAAGHVGARSPEAGAEGPVLSPGDVDGMIRALNAKLEASGEYAASEPGAEPGRRADAGAEVIDAQPRATPAPAQPQLEDGRPLVPGDPTQRAGFEDAPPVDQAGVDALLARLAQQQSHAVPDIGTNRGGEGENGAVPEPDLSGGTFEDVAPQPEGPSGATRTPQEPRAATGEGDRTSKLPFIVPGEAWGTTHEPGAARVVASRLAKQTGKPVYLVPEHGGIRIERRAPDHPVMVMHPDGTATGSTLSMKPKRAPFAKTRRAVDALEPEPGHRYAQSDPVYVKQKQALRDATFAEGQLVHGTTAQDIAGIAKAGLSPSGLSDRVDVERISKSGKSVGTAVAYAGKGGRGDPAILVLKPGVRSFETDGGAHARGTDAIRPDDIAGVIFGDGKRVRWSEAADYAAEHFPGTLPADGQSNRSTGSDSAGPERAADADQANAAAAHAAAGTEGTGEVARAAGREAAAVRAGEGDRGLQGVGAGVDATARSGATAGTPGARGARGQLENRGAGDVPGGVSGRPHEGVAGAHPREDQRSPDAGTRGDAAGGEGPLSARGVASGPARQTSDVAPGERAARVPGESGRISTEEQLGIFARNPDGTAAVIGEKPGQVSLFHDRPKPPAAKPTAEELKAVEDRKHTVPMFDEGKPSTPAKPVKPIGVEGNYTRRALQERLHRELRTEIDRRQGEVEDQLGKFARPYSFPRGIPGEIKRLLEGNPLRKKILSMLTSDQAGGEGADAMAAVGEDAYVAALEHLAGGSRSHALAVATKIGTPHQQLLAAMAEMSPKTDARMPTMEHVQADKLPTGTGMTVMGNVGVIVEPEEGERYLRLEGVKNDLPAHLLGTIPVDAGSLTAPAELNIDDVQFAKQIRALDTTLDDGTQPAASTKPKETPFQAKRRQRAERIAGTGKSADSAETRAAFLGEQEAGADQDAKRRKKQVGAGPPAKRIAVSPLPGGQTKKLRHMIDEFAVTLGHRIHQASSGSRPGSIGYYQPGSQRTVIKFSGDLDVTAHELAGHYLDDEYGILKAWSDPTLPASTPAAPFEHELIPHFSDYGSDPRAQLSPREKERYILGEGVAEWMRAYIVNPDAAKAAAPIFWAHVKTVVPPEVWSAVDDFSNDVRRFAGAPAGQKTLANVADMIQENKPGLMEKVRSAFNADALKTELLDDRWPLIKAIIEARAIREGVGDARVALRDDPETLIRLFAGEEQSIQDAIENGVPRAFSVDRRAPGVDGGIGWMMEPLAFLTKGNKLEDFEEATRRGVSYLVNRKVIDRAENWRTKDADAILAKTQDIEMARDEAIDARTQAIEKERDRLLAELFGHPQFAFKEATIRQTAANDIARMTGTMNQRAANAIAKFTQRTMQKTERRIERMAGIGGGIKNDLTVAQQAILDEARNPKDLKALEEFGRRYNKTADGLLKYMLAKGRLSRESYRAIKANNDFYADLHRVVEGSRPPPTAPRSLLQKAFQTTVHPRPQMGRRLGTGKKLIHTFKGSTLEIGNPIVNLLDQVASVIHETDKGYIVERFVHLLTKARGMHSGDPLDLDSIGSEAKKGDPGATKYFQRGEEKYFQFRPDVKAALDSMGQAPELGHVLRAASFLMKGLPQGGITKSPPFVIRQLPKDALTRAVVSRTGSGIADAFRWFDDAAKSRLARHGGMQAGLFDTAAGFDERMRQEIQRMADDASGKSILLDPWGLAKRVAGSPMQALRKYDNAAGYLGDTRTRLAEGGTGFDVGNKALAMRDQLDTALAAATTPAERDKLRAEHDAAIVKMGGEKLLGVKSAYDAVLFSAGEARSLIDYAVKGSTIRKIEPYLMFVNPTIQGTARVINAVRENPVRFAKRWGVLILLPELMAGLLRWLTGRDDDYEQLPSYRKTFFLNIPLPGGHWLAIPQPQELAVLRSALSRLVDYARGDKHAGEGLAGDTISSLMPVQPEMPFGGALRGAAENAANWQYYFQRNIVYPTERDKAVRRRPGAKYGSRLGQVISEAADVINKGVRPMTGKDVTVDPRMVDNMISNMVGGLGMLAERVSNLGRADTSTVDVAEAFTGVLRGVTVNQARDIQAVQSMARELGVDKGKEIAELTELIADANNAPPLQKARLAKVATDYAKQLRERWEKDWSAMEQEADEKFQGKEAE